MWRDGTSKKIYTEVFGHAKKMNNEKIMKKVYVSKTEGPDRRGRPFGRWKDRVKEYMSERGATRGGSLEQARRECLDKERWRLFCHGHPEGARGQRYRLL